MPQQNATPYRQLAEEAEMLANLSVFSDIRELYIRYANQWHALADETEQQR